MARELATRNRWLAGICLLAGIACAACTQRPYVASESGRTSRVLRVCADPNNLPFSNKQLEGFENKLADLVGRDLHASIAYTWWAQRRGFVRNTIGSGTCDVLMGVPTRFERTLVTRPYYRSSYVFVTRRDDGPRVASLDDPALRRVRIGVQLIGDDGMNSPPAHALAARQIIGNVVGYSVYGDYLRPNPPARIIDAVAQGDIDVAVAWGPLAGYFAPQERIALTLTPVPPPGTVDGALTFAFDMSVGVARRASALRDEIDAVLEHRRGDIDRLLDEYHVPRMDRER